jgi:hypothetical protein
VICFLWMRFLELGHGLAFFFMLLLLLLHGAFKGRTCNVGWVWNLYPEMSGFVIYHSSGQLSRGESPMHARGANFLYYS